MTEKLKDPADLHVLLVGLGHYPGLQGAEAPGCLGDLMTWFELLVNQGLPDDRLWIAASIPAPPEGRELFDRTWVDIRHVHGLTSGDRRDGQGTLESLRATIDAFVASLPRKSRALVVWAGHGWTAADGSLHLATASSRWEDGSVCGAHYALADTMPWDELVQRLAARPRSTELAIVLDSCFAASGAAHRSIAGGGDHRGQAPRVRKRDVVLMASQGAQQARQVTMQGRSLGAFSWALTSVLSRWGSAQGGWAITPEELVTRAGALLFSLGITQMPAFDGALEALRRPFLGGRGRVAPAQDLPGIEIDPDTTGRVYDVKVGTTTTLMVATTATNSQGAVAPKRLYWEQLPTGDDFTLSPSSASPPTSLPSGSVLYEDDPWASGSPPGSVGDGGWEIRVAGSLVGWMYVSSSGKLAFARTGSGVDFNSGSFTWKKPLTIPTGGPYWTAACPPK